MMKKLFTIVMLAVSLFAFNAFAATAQEMDNWAEGVNPVKKNGKIVGFTCVGWAARPGGLPKAQAARVCSGRAQAAARNAYTTFMSTQVKWQRNDKNEVSCAIKGSQQGDNEDTNVSTTETNYQDCSAEESAQMSQACISGLAAKAHGWNSDGVYVWVGAIDLSAVDAIKALAKANNEIHAEVDDMGKAEKKKKAARDANELKAIKAEGENAGAAAAAAEGAQENGAAPAGSGRSKDDNRNNTPKAGGKTPNAADFF